MLPSQVFVLVSSLVKLCEWLHPPEQPHIPESTGSTSLQLRIKDPRSLALGNLVEGDARIDLQSAGSGSGSWLFPSGAVSRLWGRWRAALKEVSGMIHGGFATTRIRAASRYHVSVGDKYQTASKVELCLSSSVGSCKAPLMALHHGT